MNYGLTRRVLGYSPFLPISRDEFLQLRQSHDGVRRALATEEKLDMALGNFVEYEHEVLQVTLNDALFSFASWSEMRQIIQHIDRRIANLLTTCKLYLDHLPQDIAPLIAGDAEAKVKELVSAEYDSRLGYRTLEALRNHVQHRGLPLHSITLGGGWVDTDEGNRRKHKTTLHLELEVLASDPKFKKSVLKELEPHGKKVPLKPLVREYITGIIKVQQGVRSEVLAALNAAEERVTAAVDRYRAEGDGILGLAAVERAPDDTDIDYEHLSLNMVERRKELVRRNHGAGELSLLIVSSE
jgi:hypothetical protein